MYVEEEGNERRTHYFMEEERLAWPQTSLSSNAAVSDTNEEDLLDFELESETFEKNSKYIEKLQPPSMRNSMKNSTIKDDSMADKDYSFFANGQVLSGLSVDVAFFPDASRSTGESSSTEEDVAVAVSNDGDNSPMERKSKKNRKKKK